MILVTLGTQDKKFYRLLNSIQSEIKKGNINEEVVVQAGYSCDFKSEDMKIFNLIEMDQFDELISKCDLLITHGGVGSIITGLKYNKKVIACARLSKYLEHTNDHQTQIVDNFSKSGYIMALTEENSLSELLLQVKKFEPKKYKSNTKKFSKLIESVIDNYL